MSGISRAEYEQRHLELRKEVQEDNADLRASVKDLYDSVLLLSNRVTVLESYGRVLAWAIGVGFPTFAGVIGYLVMHH